MPSSLSWEVSVRPGTNAIETCKALKDGDGLRIREDLASLIEKGHESLTTAEKDLLKWVGVFFRKPTPGRFMMRIRMPNGFTNSSQLRAIADLSLRLGNCVLDITTRQQIQLRGFPLGSVPEIWEKLRGVDLHSLQTGMDNVRNINGCALAGLALNELFDASPVLFELDRMLVGTDGNPEFTNLPRKFNITITGCLENCTHNESQDVALVPALRYDRPGFNVLVGGKMGSGGFTIASPLDVFVSEQEAARLLEEDLLQTFTPAPSFVRRGLVVCTGTDFCNLAQIDTKGEAAKLSASLEDCLGTTGSPMKIHWSGCPAGCGNHQAADVGFRGLKAKIDGKVVDAVAIYVGGRTGPHAAAGREIVEMTPCDETLAEVVADVIRRYDPLADPAQTSNWNEAGIPEPASTAGERQTSESPQTSSPE